MTGTERKVHSVWKSKSKLELLLLYSRIEEWEWSGDDSLDWLLFSQILELNLQ
jgi:hypothetical protein